VKAWLIVPTLAGPSDGELQGEELVQRLVRKHEEERALATRPSHQP
jgi:hypothetical protein